MDPKEILVPVGMSIRRWRKKAGLTMSQLAELAGIDIGFLAYVETGKKMPSLMTLAKIARALAIPLARLFDQASKTHVEPDYKVIRQLTATLNGCRAKHRNDLLAILKQLHNPKKARALRQIMRA